MHVKASILNQIIWLDLSFRYLLNTTMYYHLTSSMYWISNIQRKGKTSAKMHRPWKLTHTVRTREKSSSLGWRVSNLWIQQTTLCWNLAITSPPLDEMLSCSIAVKHFLFSYVKVLPYVLRCTTFKLFLFGLHTVSCATCACILVVLQFIMLLI